MKEISKKDLLVKLREQGEVDEFAWNQKGTQDTSNKLAKFRPIFKPGNTTDIPDGWELKKINTIEDPHTGEKKKELVAGSERIWVPLDGVELEAFKEANQAWLDSLTDQHGISPELVPAKKLKDQPRNAKAGTSYQHSGMVKPATTKIKIELNRLIDEYLGNPEVSARLERLSIPEVKSRDRKHLNRYGRVDNDQINYQTHTFNSYLSSTQFLKFVMSRIGGKKLDDPYKSYHLARQFNQNYQNWEETKKNQKSYLGKTPSYMLDAYGFDEDNLDVTVRMDLSIKGQLLDNQYLWTVRFKTKFGRKLKEDRWVSNGLELDKDETIRKTAQLEPGTQFDDKNTVIDSLPIKTSLIEALDELRDKIMTEYKPVEMLKKANVKQYDITKKPTVNEGVEIAKKVISKINNIKKLKK
jgi:hypothetical protein